MSKKKIQSERLSKMMSNEQNPAHFASLSAGCASQLMLNSRTPVGYLSKKT